MRDKAREAIICEVQLFMFCPILVLCIFLVFAFNENVKLSVSY